MGMFRYLKLYQNMVEPFLKFKSKKKLKENLLNTSIGDIEEKYKLEISGVKRETLRLNSRSRELQKIECQ